MINFRRKKRRVPALNTASLPDLIFSVLFFFIIVTNMREDDVKVKYRVPEGKELTRLQHKSSVIHIYIGKPNGNATPAANPDTPDGSPATAYRIQLENRYVGIDELADRVARLKSRMQPDDAQQLMVAVSADKDVDMQTMMDVKQALRRAHALRVTFIGTQKK